MQLTTTMPILIVDDYNTTIRIVRNLLRQLGFTNIDEASGAAAALAKMKARHYALVISDRDLKPMTGAELMRQARAAASAHNPPFVLLAEAAGAPARVEAFPDASACIAGPLDAASLREAMAALAA